MSVAHTFEKKIRTADVLITESVDFSGLLLSKNVLEGLLQAGFKKPSPIQLKAIPLGRCGLDLIVQAKSGTGKTCVFTVVALEGVDINFVSIQVLVLAPTREIAQQIQDVVKTIGKTVVGLKCKTFIGGLPLLQDKVSAKKCHIAVGTPGRVKQLIEIGAIETTSIRLFVLDEADKLLEGDFQESINWIYSTLPENKQMLALSATYPDYLAQHLTAYMRNPTFVRLNATDPALLGIKQFYCSVPSHPMPNVVFNSKTLAVVKLLSNINFQQCLIFSNMQTRAKNLQSELQSRNWPTACIAGCLDQKERTFAMDQLKTYKCRILISTDLTSRGIDADKVNLVINMDIPADHETYLHRIGRAGRFGSHGAAITIITSDMEINELQDIENKCNTTIKELPEPIPRDLIIKPEVVSLDDVVTSEQIINKPEMIQNDMKKKDLSLPSYLLKEDDDVSSLTEDISQENSVTINNSEAFCKTYDETDLLTHEKENHFLSEEELREPKTFHSENTVNVFQAESEKINYDMPENKMLDKEELKTDQSDSSDQLVKKMLKNSNTQDTYGINNIRLSSDISEDKTFDKENHVGEAKHGKANFTSMPGLLDNKMIVSNTVNTQLKGRLAEDDLPTGSDSNSPSNTPQREIARSRQRRRAPRSLAVCDFLQCVQDDLLGVKDTGAGGDNLECKSVDFTTIASDVDNIHSIANVENNYCDQSQQYRSEAGDQTGNIEPNKHKDKSTLILEPGQLVSLTGSVYSSTEDRKQPCSQDDLFHVKELSGMNGDGIQCDGDLADSKLNNDEAVVINPPIRTVSDSNEDIVIQSDTSCTVKNETDLDTSSPHVMIDKSTSQNASIQENGDICPPLSNTNKDLSNVQSGVSAVSSLPDFNGITSTLSFMLTQTEKGIQSVSFTKLVGDHTDFCEHFDKTSLKYPEFKKLSESLELTDAINWQKVCEGNTMKLDHFKSNINNRLHILKTERLLHKDRMVDRDSSELKVKYHSERNSTRNSAKKNFSSSTVEDNYAEDSENKFSKQVKKTGKSKKRKKSPKPSDNLDWRSAQLDNIVQRKGKEALAVQINADNGQQVPVEDHRLGSTLHITPLLKRKQVEFKTSPVNTENLNSLTGQLESGSTNAEVNNRVERVSVHQKSVSKDEECQALDDMHDLMLKRRQERKRLMQQSSASASAKLSQDERRDTANCTSLDKNERIDSDLKSASVSLEKNFATQQNDSGSRSEQTDKQAVEDSEILCKNKDIEVGFDKPVKKLASVIKNDVKLEIAVDNHCQRLHSEGSLLENKKLMNRNPECLVTTVGKFKPKKPSKTRARLAGLEVSDGSTSSSFSSHLSLSSTSDISDVLSDEDCEHQILKFQCYANRYADDEKCMLHDSTRSDAHPVHGSHSLYKHQNTESSPYSMDEAYHKNYCITSYSPHVPSCLPASNVLLQHPKSKFEHSATSECSMVDNKSKKYISLLKNNQSSRCLHGDITGGTKINNEKKASHDSKYHPNMTFIKKGKSSSFKKHSFSENNSNSDHPTESEGSSNQYYQHFHHQPSFCTFIPATCSCNRVIQPHTSPYFTHQQQMSSPYFSLQPVYFPQNLSFWSYQWYFQYQYINCMTKAYTYFLKSEGLK